MLKLDRKGKVSKAWVTKERPIVHQGRISFHETIEKALEGHTFESVWKKSDEFLGTYSAY
jgi:hypothetical protein